MRYWFTRHRRVLSVLLAVAMLSTFPLANAMINTPQAAMAASDAMPCHHPHAAAIATTYLQHGCCQDNQSCLQHCLAGLVVNTALSTQPQMNIRPVRRALIVTPPDKILFSFSPLPEFDPPR